MAFWKSLSGQFLVAITSADLGQMLTTVNQAGLLLQDIVFLDDLQLQAVIPKQHLRILKDILDNRGDSIEILHKKGVYWRLMSLTSRPVFVIGMTILLFFCFFLPSRVLFVEVSGNTKIPDQYIIETAQSCGIGFFASRKDVRSEKMKNALLTAIPQLQWAGINTKGCVAVISVRERREKTAITDKPQVNSIVANRDGVIQKLTVLSGTPLCQVGQGVKAGQVLVSGFTDCGLVIKAQQADAEVIAYTFRNLQATTPLKYDMRTKKQGHKTKYMLRFGKNIINLWKDSGISDTRCVKMYSEEYLTLPGGFQLPVALIIEKNISYDFLQVTADESQLSWMSDVAAEYLTENMVAGSILGSHVALSQTNDLLTLTGKYTCLEMIGKVRNEENVTQNGI